MEHVATSGTEVSSAPSVSLITVSYNSERDLREFWSGFDPSWGEWIVVDNASGDESVGVAQSLGATVVQANENLGFSGANNLGAERSSGDVLIFCNPDVRVTPDGIRQLAELATEAAGLVAPQLVNSDGSPQENGRGVPYPYRKLAHMFLKHRKTRYTRIAGHDEVIAVVWVMGAAVSMTAKVFDEIGGWDDGFFVYYEDADICLRAIEHGYSVRVDGGVRWTHGWARETAKGFSWSAWRHELRSAARFYRVHPSSLVPIRAKTRRIDRQELTGVPSGR